MQLFETETYAAIQLQTSDVKVTSFEIRWELKGEGDDDDISEITEYRLKVRQINEAEDDVSKID